MQNTFLSLPLVLLPEEVTLLLEKSVIRVERAKSLLKDRFSEEFGDNNEEAEEESGWGWPETEAEKEKMGVFRDLWGKGYYMTAGLKFGGDPMRHHSAYIATVVGRGLAGQDLVGLGRVGTNVRKRRLLCSWDKTTKKADVCGFQSMSLNLYFDHIDFDPRHAELAYRKKLITRKNLANSNYSNKLFIPNNELLHHFAEHRKHPC
ncbi:hypothetical protein BB559_006246 [Furculomyces boomerangus]|uniref:tRNA-intron lyase n=1 Tax=Furculomyces boomerangus TaxID=61424 RepID=A0A2T9Y415_9FUNG|nr:hypothetical protein BB559_006246 [Furculomyces boomerangus]